MRRVVQAVRRRLLGQPIARLITCGVFAALCSVARMRNLARMRSRARIRSLAMLCSLPALYSLPAMCSLPAISGKLAAAEYKAKATAVERTAPAIVDLRVGVRGLYKSGLWTEAVVTVRAGSQPLSARVSLTVPDGDGLPSRFFAPQPVRLEGGQAQEVSLLIRIGRVQATIVAEVESDGQIIARRHFRAGQSEHFPTAIEGRSVIVVIGPADPGIEQASLSMSMPAEIRPAVALVDDIQLINHLPNHHMGYEGVSALVLTTSKPELVGQLAGDATRVRALEQWIAAGGKLVILGGPQAEQALADDSPLRRLLPGRIDGITTLERTAGLETFCRSSISIRPAGDTAAAVQASRLSEVQGNIVLSEEDLPLVVRRAWALGQVSYLAVDLNQPPLSTWHDRGRFVAALLEFPVLPEQLGYSPVELKLGYDDIAGQLRSALDRYQSVTAAPFGFVAVVLLIYMLLIGPADYFLLRRFARRMEWTWLTSALLVVLFCFFGWWLSGWLKGERLRTHQVDVIDVDLQSGSVRGTTWVNVFTPHARTFDFSLQPRLPDGRSPIQTEVFISWLGLPGAALGGMQGTQLAAASGPIQPYEFSLELNAINRVPIPVASSKSLTARWTARTDAFPAIQLREEGHAVVGTIQNTLPIPLRRCLLTVGRWAYELGDIEAGQTVTIGLETPRTDLKTLLTGRRVALYEGGQKFFQHATPYDASSTDVHYILRMMSFFEDGGGQQYTGLKNQYQSFMDVGHLLKAGRAVLLGFGPGETQQARSELLDAGKPVAQSDDPHVVLLRFVAAMNN